MKTLSCLPFAVRAALLFALLLPALPASAGPVGDSVDIADSWISSISYERDAPDAPTGVLTVTLATDPDPLRYFEVPVDVWEEFKDAPSKGSFYGSQIRQRFERVYGHSRADVWDAPYPVETKIDALCAFNEECEEVVLRAIAAAKTSIYVAAYAFTRTRIANALAEASRRGVRVALKMDSRQAEHPGAQRLLDLLRDAGVSVSLIFVEGDYAAMHNKFMVFDLRTLVTGSYNFTTQAQVVNWENLVWIDSPDMAELYKQAWDAIVSD
ncbi:MAG: KTSC domain-containing protein [Kiritimatiellae bacterium]|nr:KTSC domain-containing protein [Kiritimatiellia bacterium]